MTWKENREMIGKKQRRMINGLVLLGGWLFLTTARQAGTMHIMEGFLPPGWCGLWFLAALPFWIGYLVYSRVSLGKALDTALPLLTVASLLLILSLRALLLFITRRALLRINPG